MQFGVVLFAFILIKWHLQVFGQTGVMAPIHPAAIHLERTQTFPVYVFRALYIVAVVNIGAQLLTAQGASDTLTYMQSYWQNVGGTDEELWEHEWAKHGTCMRSVLIFTSADLGSPFHL